MGKDKGKNLIKKEKGKKKVIEEGKAEDWCFVCKEGGHVLICEHKGCGKVYHPNCVNRRNSILRSEGRWTCPRHSCAECGGSPQFYCLACPDSLCRLCVGAYEFVTVKSNKGLCKSCFEYALLAEKDAEFDSEGVKYNFHDRDSDDCLFKEYLLIIMKQEELNFNDFHRAHSKRENDNSGSDCDKIADKDVISLSDAGSDSDYASESDDSSGKRKKSQKKLGQKKKIRDILKDHFADTVELSISDEKENDGGSCSENEDELIISECKSLKTFSPDKVPVKEKVKHAVKKRRRTSSPDKVPVEEKVEPAVKKRRRTSSPDKVPLKKKVEYAVQKSCYAAIVAENIKLVYLRRSLVEEMLKQPDNFEEKIVGSYVRLKRVPGNCSGTTRFQLVQVADMKKPSNAGNKWILVVVCCTSCMPVDIPIDMLNDDDISEEECEDLQQRMKDGLLKKPTVVELEQKAKSLHEDITKNRIKRELVQVENKILFSHEKGRKNMFYTLEQYLNKKKTLEKPSEQQRLLQTLPTVTAEANEIDESDGNSSESDCST